MKWLWDENYIRKKETAGWRLSVLTDIHGIKVRGWLAPFMVEGSKELIQVGMKPVLARETRWDLEWQNHNSDPKAGCWERWTSDFYDLRDGPIIGEMSQNKISNFLLQRAQSLLH